MLNTFFKIQISSTCKHALAINADVAALQGIFEISLCTVLAFFVSFFLSRKPIYPVCSRENLQERARPFVCTHHLTYRVIFTILCLLLHKHVLGSFFYVVAMCTNSICKPKKKINDLFVAMKEILWNDLEEKKQVWDIYKLLALIVTRKVPVGVKLEIL